MDKYLVFAVNELDNQTFSQWETSDSKETLENTYKKSGYKNVKVLTSDEWKALQFQAAELYA